MKVFFILVAILGLTASSIWGGCAKGTPLSKQAITGIELTTVQVGDINVA